MGPDAEGGDAGGATSTALDIEAVSGTKRGTFQP